MRADGTWHSDQDSLRMRPKCLYLLRQVQSQQMLVLQVRLAGCCKFNCLNGTSDRRTCSKLRMALCLKACLHTATLPDTQDQPGENLCQEGHLALGGSWVAMIYVGLYKSPNLDYNHSYPTYNPTYNFP